MEVLRIEQIIQEAHNSLTQIGLAESDERLGIVEQEIPPFYVHDADALGKLVMMLMSEADSENPVSFGISRKSRSGMVLTVRSGACRRSDRYRVFLRRLNGKVRKDGSNNSFTIPCVPLPDRAEKPPISLKAVIQEVGDEETAMLIVNQYIEHLKEQLPRIRTALDRDDYITAHREAHSIKGGALNLHAPYLAEEAKRLERNAKNGSLELGYSMLETIAGYISEIESYLEELSRGAKNDAYSPGPLR